MKLEKQFSAEGIRLRLDRHVTLPLGSAVRDLARSVDERAALLALDEVWQQGMVEPISPGYWLVPYERLVHMDQPPARAMGLPVADLRLQASLISSGIWLDPGFKISLSVRHPVHGSLDAARRSGPAFLLENEICVLMPPDLWNLAAAVEANPPADADDAERAEYLARCKDAAAKAEATLDGYLRDESVAIVDEVQLDADEEDDSIVLSARSGVLRHEDLVLPSGAPKPFPSSERAELSRTRLVLSRNAREKVRQINEGRRLSGSQVPEFLLNPEAFVPEGIDLSDFSKRVRGFRTRVYNSRPYLHTRAESRGWLELDVGIGLESAIDDGEVSQAPTLTIDEYRELARQARESGDRFVRKGSDWVEVDPEQAIDFLDVADRVTRRAENGRIRVDVLLDVIPNVDALEFDVRVPGAEEMRRAWHSELPNIQPPASFNGQLDQHQLFGFRWLSYLFAREAGGLLADEMGVGKTAQVIAHLCRLDEAGDAAPSLVVLPKTLVSNWRQELERFAPSIGPVWVHSGPNRSRSENFLASNAIVLTTYETARADQIMLARIDWKVVVADEAQFIKNPTAARTAVVKAMKAKQALALTGTPVENGLIEFWCIVDYVQPGLLGSWRDFRSEFERPLVSVAGEEDRQPIVEELLSRLDPHYLRRMKSEVLADLPEKRGEALRSLPLGPLQEERYRQIVQEAKGAGRGAVLGALTRLRMTCAHPRASVGDWEDVPAPQLIEECPKLEATMVILGRVREQSEKAVIFTEFRNVQRIIQRAILHRFDLVAEVINGEVVGARDAIIDAFRRSEGFAVLILNPGVAGFGINLTEANHVIHYTRPWNPAKEAQATDRVHRRGQQRPVSIYLPTSGIVEEKLAELLEDKESLARDVLRPSRERVVTPEELLEAAGLMTSESA